MNTGDPMDAEPVGIPRLAVRPGLGIPVPGAAGPEADDYTARTDPPADTSRKSPPANRPPPPKVPPVTESRPSVLSVRVHNADRSRTAAAFLTHLGRDEIETRVLGLLAELGIEAAA
ncbi:hypothetical protein [Kitasatospora sp. HPMI-4]|uniref:hypothetical protein n=1 Tax=Kitasatospora sp. HPMI-4 TaxID=3448443 RepID=UPI003F1D7E58